MKKICCFLFVLVLVMPGFGFGAQLEFLIGGSFNIPSLNNTYNQTFSPGFLYESSTVTQATNMLNLEGKNSTGVFMAANFLFNPNFGIQAVAEFHKTSLQGTENLYRIHLEYTALYPPDYTPTAETFDRDVPLPDTDGHINQLTLGLNLLTRFNIGSRLNFDLSGGLSYFRIKGESSTLGYSFYWFGGNSVLFSEFFKLGFNIEPASKIGINASGAINVKITNMISFFLACRYFYCSDISANITLKEILNFREIISIRTLEEITAVMNPAPIEINPSFLSFSSGFKLNL